MMTNAADEKFVRDLTQIFEQFETDTTPIRAIHSTGWENGCFYIWLDMADHREVLLHFEPGKPIPTVKKPTPTQHARLVPYVEPELEGRLSAR